MRITISDLQTKIENLEKENRRLRRRMKEVSAALDTAKKWINSSQMILEDPS